MKKIIVPTDFSPTAANAFAYAKKLADLTNSPLKVVHFFHPSAANSEILMPTLEEMEKSVEEQLQNFTSTSVNENGDIKTQLLLETEVKAGFAAEEIVELSKERNTDFILMGTTGDGGVLENLVGSVSSAVAQEAYSPVWLIPPHTSFNGINNIMFAGDYDNVSNDMIDEIIDLAQLFGANIHLVHVNEKGGAPQDSPLREKVLHRFVEKKISESYLKMKTIEGHSIWEPLQEYATTNSIDLTVVVTKHRGFWGSMFHKSTTKAMILHAKRPLLILHQNS